MKKALPVVVLSGRCYGRTSMTKAEYDSARRKLESKDRADKERNETDPRYEQWIP